MEQKELELRVKQIFEQQGFEVKRWNDEFVAGKGSTEKEIQVFSSEDHNLEDLKNEVEPGTLVFVDTGLESIVEEIENEVSVIREDDTEDYDLPSYEIIGDLVIISELSGDEDESVKGILEHHPHVETILLKEEPLSGEFRVGGYRKLYGEETETTHKEFGCRYRIDPTKAYFSERLATERKRVVDQIQGGEKILVIGAGVGPYAILAARKASPERIVAVEKNPDAFEYLEANIELNGVEDTVEAVEGDALEVVSGKFDRIIIAIPEFGNEFLELAFEHADTEAKIHYYSFMEDKDWEPLMEEVERVAEKLGMDYRIEDRAVCGQRGPSVDRVCIDIELVSRK